jgi:hypothetical protein
MANELLILPLHLILSVQGQKVEAKPRVLNPRERSQGRTAMGGDEVASLPSRSGLHMGRCLERASMNWAKFDQSASIQTGRDVVRADNDALKTSVRHAITIGKRNIHRTDEVPRCPPPRWVGVSATYKSETKGLPDASETGMASLQPRLKGYRQRQSRGSRRSKGLGRSVGECSERQNLRVHCGLSRFMGPVSPGIKATTWPGRTSSCQIPGSLRNSPQQPGWTHRAVQTR